MGVKPLKGLNELTHRGLTNSCLLSTECPEERGPKKATKGCLEMNESTRHAPVLRLPFPHTIASLPTPLNLQAQKPSFPTPTHRHTPTYPALCLREMCGW